MPAIITRPTDPNQQKYRHDVRLRWAAQIGNASAESAERSTWLKRSPELAGWTMRQLANRTDVWGGYLPHEARGDGRGNAVTKPRIEFRGQQYLGLDVLARHYAGRDVGHLVGLHAIGRTGDCRWICWDIDNHGSANSSANIAYAVYLFDKLASLGFSPLLLDSNGRGGFHLIVIFADPVSSCRVFRFAKWAISDHASHGLLCPPETFPKQPDLEGRTFGNWLRLPGRHHTRNHWSKAWNGASFVAGDAAIDLIVGTAGDSSELIPPSIAADPPRRRVGLHKRPAAGDGRAVERAARYVAKMQVSISGQHGHDRLLSAACVCWRFGLSAPVAVSILEDFNSRCIPPWPARDVSRKWCEAAKVCGPAEFGVFLDERHPNRGRRTARRRVAIFNVGAA